MFLAPPECRFMQLVRTLPYCDPTLIQFLVPHRGKRVNVCFTQKLVGISVTGSSCGRFAMRWLTSVLISRRGVRLSFTRPWRRKLTPPARQDACDARSDSYPTCHA